MLNVSVPRRAHSTCRSMGPQPVPESHAGPRGSFPRPAVTWQQEIPCCEGCEGVLMGDTSVNEVFFQAKVIGKGYHVCCMCHCQAT